MLKAAGVSNFIAREIVGRESALQVHAPYSGRQARGNAAVARRDKHL